MISVKLLTASVAALALLGSTALAGSRHSTSDNLAGRPGNSKTVVRTVRLVASEIRFDIDKLAFKAGDTVRFIIVNKGEQDHELAIGDRAFQLGHRKEMEASATMNHAEMKGIATHDQAAGSAVTAKLASSCGSSRGREGSSSTATFRVILRPEWQTRSRWADASRTRRKERCFNR